MGNIGNAILFTLAKCAPVFTTVIILAIVIAIIVGISKTMYKKAPPNTAMVITGPRGCRTAIGKGCFVIPIIQRDIINKELAKDKELKGNKYVEAMKAK